MKQVSRILVPIDLDKHTGKLIAYALFMAKGLDAEIVLFHAVDIIFHGEMALGNLSYEDHNANRLENAQKAVDELVKKCESQNKKCSGMALMGDAVDEILEAQKKENIDLIIIGTHGKRGLEKILLGSVAERVLKNATCPVLVMNPYKQTE